MTTEIDPHGEEVTAERVTNHTAREAHHCHTCGFPIETGEKYAETVWKGLGGMWFTKHCFSCETPAPGEDYHLYPGAQPTTENKELNDA